MTRIIAWVVQTTIMILMVLYLIELNVCISIHPSLYFNASLLIHPSIPLWCIHVFIYQSMHQTIHPSRLSSSLNRHSLTLRCWKTPRTLSLLFCNYWMWAFWQANMAALEALLWMWSLIKHKNGDNVLLLGPLVGTRGPLSLENWLIKIQNSR